MRTYLPGYIKTYRAVIALLLGTDAIFVLVHALGLGDVQELGYALVLTGVVYMTALAYSFARYCLRMEQLRETIRQLPPDPAALPDVGRPVEDMYRALARAYQHAQAQAIAQAAQDARERVEYYTMWMHQIKTPIAAMDLMAQSDAPIDKTLVRQELFKIGQYADAALSFQRLKSMQNDLELTEVALYPLCCRVIRGLRVLFLYKRISLDMQAFDDVVLSDAKWLGMILTQVLTNALKYTPESGRIAVQLVSPGILRVTDTGIGIRAEDIPRVFERGFTGAIGRDSEKSTGIGLYLCKETCRRLGHGITLENENGGGVAVTIDMRHDAYETF